MQSSYGPNVTEKYTNNAYLIKFMDASTKYVSGLSNFEKYCVWRYTIGSASINSYLIFEKLSDNSTYWTYLFFKYYKNTYGSKYLPKQFTKWKPYFDNPDSMKRLSSNSQNIIAKGMIEQYIILMQNIILKAPKTPGSFHVFKVASPYPGLPTQNNELPARVLQLPFNSTTVTPYFNFAPFLSPTSTCCLFDIKIPKGSSCLFVPQEFHAYPFELEIILPHDCIFNVVKIREGILDYIDPKTVNIVQVQDKDNIQLGAVYQLNDYSPCGSSGCVIQSKNFTVYDTVYVNP